MDDLVEGNLLLDVVQSFLKDDGQTLLQKGLHWLRQTHLIPSDRKAAYETQLEEYTRVNGHAATTSGMLLILHCKIPPKNERVKPGRSMPSCAS